MTTARDDKPEASQAAPAVGIRLDRSVGQPVPERRECAAIKAEDDHCADRDYMLDSDDCIKVALGQWVRPE